MFPRQDSGSGFTGAPGGGSSGGIPGGLPPNSTAAGGANPFAQTAGSTGAAAAGAIPIFPFFTPSFDVALAGAVVFFALTVVHVYLVFKTKAAYFGLGAQAVLGM
jgi:hypothetical protein